MNPTGSTCVSLGESHHTPPPNKRVEQTGPEGMMNYGAQWAGSSRAKRWAEQGAVLARDERFVAAHRGGPLGMGHHRLLASWAADCAEHVLPLFSVKYPHDDRPRRAIDTARAWSRGEVTVGEARAAAQEAHAAARDATDDAAQAVARATGHAVATAHMADHSLQATAYAIRAVNASAGGRDGTMAVELERTWQHERLPEEIRALVVSAGGREPATG